MKATIIETEAGDYLATKPAARDAFTERCRTLGIGYKVTANKQAATERSGRQTPPDKGGTA